MMYMISKNGAQGSKIEEKKRRWALCNRFPVNQDVTVVPPQWGFFTDLWLWPINKKLGVRGNKQPGP